MPPRLGWCRTLLTCISDRLRRVVVSSQRQNTKKESRLVRIHHHCKSSSSGSRTTMNIKYWQVVLITLMCGVSMFQFFVSWKFFPPIPTIQLLDHNHESIHHHQETVDDTSSSSSSTMSHQGHRRQPQVRLRNTTEQQLRGLGSHHHHNHQQQEQEQLLQQLKHLQQQLDSYPNSTRPHHKEGISLPSERDQITDTNTHTAFDPPPPLNGTTTTTTTQSTIFLVSPTDYIMQKGFDQSPIVLEDYKLIFFTVPKVGCTVWKQLFRRITLTRNKTTTTTTTTTAKTNVDRTTITRHTDSSIPKTTHHDSNNNNNNKGNIIDNDMDVDWKNQTVVHDPALNGLTYLADYSIEEANHMMISPEWTKALFVRSPKERFLSAYLDKAVSNFGIHLIPCCEQLRSSSSSSSKNNHGTTNTTASTKESSPIVSSSSSSKLTSVEACVNRAQATLLNFFALIQSCPTDGHWLPQSQRLDAKYWPLLSSSSSSANRLFVGQMDHAQDDAKRLLQQIGAWDRYGRSGWGPTGQDAIFAKGTGTGLNHVTGAKHQLTWYYTPEVERLVDSYYAQDYDLKILSLNQTAIIYD